MAVHKFILDDFEEADYQLIAIHTNLELFRIAFLLNRELPILLSKNQKKVILNHPLQKLEFSLYRYDDEKKEQFWSLIPNKEEVLLKSNKKSRNLFETEENQSQTFYFLPELKKVDYFLKMEGDFEKTDNAKLLSSINRIEQVTTAYWVAENLIKSKNNLIF
ncbi:IPExxxVDY family protein [Flavobacterium sp.]|uniref:IPExxxVDY family protein n=1 Tax=Flavobacterium sp. TaxID=239 RepID=UPI002FD9294B